MNYKMVILGVLAVLAVLFIVQNMAVVEISLLFWSIQMSRSVMILVLLVVGAAIGWFLRGYYAHQKPKE